MGGGECYAQSTVAIRFQEQGDAGFSRWHQHAHWGHWMVSGQILKKYESYSLKHHLTENIHAYSKSEVKKIFLPTHFRENHVLKQLRGRIQKF